VMDRSTIAIRCTLWGKSATDWNHPVGSVIAIKAASLSDFNGCSMSIGMSSKFEVNPDLDAAHELREWYEAEGKDASVQKIANTGGGGGQRVDTRIMMHEIKDRNLGMATDGTKDYFLVRGTVTYCPNNEGSFIYNACPSANCQKKVVEESSNEWHCVKCNQNFQTFEHRMIPRFSVQDATGQTWISTFNDVAEQIFNSTAKEMGELKDNQQEDAFNSKVQGALWKQFMFKCAAKADTYNDETRVRINAMAVTEVDPVAESKFLIAEINKY